jgi:hypothetical protein
MADLSKLSINGTAYDLKDTAARATAAAVTAAEEYDRQVIAGTYGGRSLADAFAGEIGTSNVYAWLQSRAKAGNFTGLRIGDYMDVPVSATTNVPAQTVRYQIAAIDPYYQCGDQPKGHHIAFVPRATVAVQGAKAVNNSYIHWRDTNDNNGTADVKNPYLVSKLHDWEINDFLPALPSALRNVLMTQRVLLEERYSSSTKLTESAGWSWQDLGKVWSLSETEVYGQCVWGTKGYSVGFDCHFPIFDSTAKRLNGDRADWWLRSVAGGSASHACYVDSAGIADGYVPTGEWVRPRPCFLIG